MKLLDFYSGMNGGAEGGNEAEAEVMLETAETSKASGSMRGLRAVGEECMGVWLGEWGF